MRILVISDIHGNADALLAVLSSVRGVDDVIVLGDLVDYGPEPDRVVDIVKSHGYRVVMGNHDYAAAFNADCRCGPATKDLSVYTRKNITLRKLSKNDLAYLSSLPKSIEIEVGGKKILCVHATPRDPLFKYLYPWAPPVEVNEEVLSVAGSYRAVLVGHTHHQYLRTQRSIWLANPGSVGQPRDGDPRASVAILDEDGIKFLRIKYDVEAVLRKLREEVKQSDVYSRLASILVRGCVQPPQLTS